MNKTWYRYGLLLTLLVGAPAALAQTPTGLLQVDYRHNDSRWQYGSNNYHNHDRDKYRQDSCDWRERRDAWRERRRAENWQNYNGQYGGWQSRPPQYYYDGYNQRRNPPYYGYR